MGKVLVFTCLYRGNTYTADCLLCPPPYSSEVVAAGLSFMTLHPTVFAVWLGDFNMIMNPFMDCPVQSTSVVGEPRQTRLSCILADFAFIDVWQHRTPIARAYTCHSTSHATMSRIDYIYYF